MTYRDTENQFVPGESSSASAQILKLNQFRIADSPKPNLEMAILAAY
jgi:hypothetical protein